MIDALKYKKFKKYNIKNKSCDPGRRTCSTDTNKTDKRVSFRQIKKNQIKIDIWD